MGIRYNNRSKRNNAEEVYDELFESRGVTNIDHYVTPEFERIEMSDRISLENVLHVWSTGDRYWKLASKYYGDSTLWWLIAWYNRKPTEAHVELGDSIAVPLPLNRALSLFSR